MVHSGRLADDRIALALRAGGVGTWYWDRNTGAVEWDGALEALFGLPEGGFDGNLDHWVALTHPDDRALVQDAIADALGHQGDYRIVHRIVRPDGGIRWIECRGELVRDGETSAMIGIALDITQRHELEAEHERVRSDRRKARQRLAFLAQASDLLFRSLDVEASLRELARLLVPRVADWAVISLLRDGHLEPVTVVHNDPERGQLFRDILDRYGRRDTEASRSALRTGQPQMLGTLDATFLRSIAVDEEHLRLLEKMRFGATLVVPLQARDTMLGTVWLGLDPEHGPFDSDDVQLTEDVARRASFAIDNARLYEQQRRLVDALQQSLLPTKLPEIPGVELAVRYQPASPHTEICGDFYKAFKNGHDTWTLLIGDVRGKGPEAAALTGLVRHTVRAAAFRDPDPAEILSVLNEALIEHDPFESFCTAVCLDLERVDAETTIIGFSGGGHPPALLVRADGDVEEIPSSGMLLGLFPDAGCETTTLRLVPGDTLVLYTDGVTEARREGELFGLGRLRRLLEGVESTQPERLATRIMEAVEKFQGEQHRDDIAVLTVGPARLS